MAKFRPPLSDEEIRCAFAVNRDHAAPAIISPAQLAALIGRSTKTVYFWIAEGRLDGAVRRRGKHLLVWRDRAIATLLNDAEWN